MIIIPSSFQSTKTNETTQNYLSIVNGIIRHVNNQIDIKYLNEECYRNKLFHELLDNEYIKKSSINHKTITVEFIDGYQIVLLDPRVEAHQLSPYQQYSSIFEKYSDDAASAKILHPFAQVYGKRQCKVITRLLRLNGISSEYVENNEVDLRYIENNLSGEIIYMNTHAGFWDINEMQQIQTVVIATGEEWTEETISKYNFEYVNKLIVEGIVGEKSYVSFTPGLIDHYYNDTSFQDSFVYMATCHALFDTSMASVFLEKNASVYVSWTKDTVFWTNSLSSIWVFRFLTMGLTIERICDIIGYGGFYNLLFDSQLDYFGNGNFTLI
jgi:hypothetical protein